MIISVWRYSHLCLAVSSFLLLTLSSLSGIVLAFEPVVERSKLPEIAGLDTANLSQIIPVVKEKLPTISELTVNEFGFVAARYTDDNGKNKTSYINPITGELYGTPGKQAVLFEWMTALHRSLFLHETGRLLIGITSFLLILIALSGIGLIIQRQKGIKRFFSPIEKTAFAQYYHAVFGRLSLLFILAVALTGTYLSVSRFIIRPEKINAVVKEDELKDEPRKPVQAFEIMQQTKFSEVKNIQFPFSDFPEDYFTLKLIDREICVNQFTGEMLATAAYSSSQQVNSFSLRWHTGRSSIVWAIILAITSAYILFFIYSGLFIAWKRIRSKSKNRYKPGVCQVIILVGSENGSTYKFASAVYKQLLQHGEKVYIGDLDTYTIYPNAEHLIVMTSTYGEGDPPSNAKKFLSRLAKYPQQQAVQFSVLGFGSRSYQHFCRFADDVSSLLDKQAWAHRALSTMTVNDKSPQDFSNWLTEFMRLIGQPLVIPRKLLSSNLQGLQKISIIDKTEVNGDNVFHIRMKAKRFNKIASGDLLAVYPKNDHRERLYSIGKVYGHIQLSVHLYQNGLGSVYLNNLQYGENIKARIIKNQHFHFPKNASKIIMVSNGTGIAPFLGMIAENKKKLPCHLYCGFRTAGSFHIYRSLLDENIGTKNLESYQLALSREGDKQYVSQLLEKDSAIIYDVITQGGVLMICGSLPMQKGVLKIVEKILHETNGEELAHYLNTGKILTDCY